MAGAGRGKVLQELCQVTEKPKPGDRAENDVSDMDAVLKGWNPMLDDFRSPEFNSYDKGPGRCLPSDRQRPYMEGDGKSPVHIELYVTGIPMELTEEGLVNLFSRAGKVLRASKMRSKIDNGTTFGFIRFGTVSEAECALRLLDNKWIQKKLMRVRIALTPEQKEKRRKERELEAQMKLVNDDRDDNADEDVNTSQVTETVQPAITNLPFSLPLTPSVLGTDPNTVSSPARQTSSASAPSGGDKSDQAVRQTRGSAAQGTSPSPVRMPSGARVSELKPKEQPKPCLYCSKLSERKCSRCKGSYCSRECQLGDWPRHKHLCGKPVDDFEKQFDIDIGDDTIDKVAEMVLGTKDIPLCRDKKDVLSSPSDDEKEEEVCPQEAPQTIHQGVMRPTRRVTPPHITGAAIVKAVMAADLHQEALSSDTVTKVMLASLVNPSDFTLVKYNSFQMFRTQHASIQGMFKKGREGDAPSNYRPTVGEACVACCHSDKKWYRVRVDTVQEDELTVSNLDLGKVENVSVSDVQPLPVELKELPLQGIKCGLAGLLPASSTGQWSTMNQDIIETLLPASDCYYAELILQHPDRALVRLFCAKDHQNMGEKLIEEGFAKLDVETTTSPQSLPLSVKRPKSLEGSPSGALAKESRRFMTIVPQPSVYDRLEVGVQVQVRVTEPGDPSSFWVQVQRDAENHEFHELQRCLKMHYDEKKPKHGFRCPGHNMVAVKDPSGTWFRAHVLDYDNIDVTVRFVDFGSTARAGFTDVLALEGRYITLPYQALHCGISGIEPVDGVTWSADATRFLTDYTMDCLLEAKVMKRTEELTLLDIQDPKKDLSLGDALVAAGHAQPVGSGSGIPSMPAGHPRPVGPPSGFPSMAVGHTRPGSSAGMSMLAGHAQSAGSVSDLLGQTPPLKPSVVMADSLQRDELTVSKEKHSVVLVFSSSPTKLTIQRICHAKGAARLWEKLATQLSTYSGSYMPTSEGELVYTRYNSDQAWYRAKVLWLNEDKTVDIEFIDYGNRETVTCDHIAPVDPLTPQPVVYGIQCSLAGVHSVPVGCDWRNITASLMQVKLFAEVKQKCDHQYEITLYQPETSRNINDILAQTEDTRPVEDSADTPMPALDRTGGEEDLDLAEDLADTLMPALVRTGGEVPLTETVLPAEDLEDTLMPALVRVGGEVPLTETVLPAEDLEDTLMPALVRVGGEVPLTETGLPAEDLEDTPMPVLVRVGGVVPLTVESVGNTSLPVIAGGGIPALSLPRTQCFQDIGDPLVHIWYIEHPGSFYCQWINQTVLQKFQADCEKMQEMYCQPGLMAHYPSEGDLITAQSPTDGVWYRAVILNIGPLSEATVRFVDYGNTEAVAVRFIRRLDESFWELPFQAVHCCLVGFAPPGGGWTPAATAIFREVAQNQNLRLTISGHENGTYNVSDITDTGGVSILRSLAQSLEEDFLVAMVTAKDLTDCLEPTETEMSTTSAGKMMSPSQVVQPTQVKSTPVFTLTLLPEHNLQTMFDAQVTEVQTPHLFYIQPYKDADMVKITKLVTAHCQSTGYSLDFHPAVGHLCCARFTADGLWYRASVTAVHSDGKTFTVNFIDFGNNDTVQQDEICSFTEDLAAFPPKALSCALSAVWPPESGWSKFCVNGFRAMVVHEVVRVTLGLVVHGVQQVTMVNQEGVNLATTLVKRGMATALPPTEALRQENQELRQEMKEMRQLLQQLLQRVK